MNLFQSPGSIPPRPALVRLARAALLPPAAPPASLWLLAGVVALGAGQAGLILAQAHLLSAIVARVFLGGAGWSAVQGLVAAGLAVIAGRAAAALLSDLAAHAAAARVKHAVRAHLLQRIQALGPAYTSQHATGELAVLAHDGVEALDAYVSQYLPQLALAALLPAMFLAAVFPRDALSGGVLLLTAPLVPLFMILIGRAAEHLTRAQWTALQRMAARFLDVLQGLTTLKLLNQAAAEARRLETLGERYRQTTLEALRLTFLSALALELIATISTALVAVQIGLRLLAGGLEFQAALLVLILAPEVYLPLRQLGLRFHAGAAGAAALCEIARVEGGETSSERTNSGGTGSEQRTASSADPCSELRTASSGGSAVRRGGMRGTADRKPGSFNESSEGIEPGDLLTFEMAMRRELVASAVRFDRVTLAYPDSPLPALHSVSFALLPGQITALVGPSGAGKSTVLQVLLRFREPQAGQVWVGQHALPAIPARTWRRLVAWAPQQPYLFAGTLAENLRLAAPGASDAALWQACEQARLAAWVARLPLGLATPVGERGLQLSGGQAQRLSLARAFLKDAPLLLLDEPSTALDSALEAELSAAIAHLARGRTTLIVSHRPAPLAAAAQIIRLDGGRVTTVERPEGQA